MDKSKYNRVIGITHGRRKNTGEPYTIIFYSVPISKEYGTGVEGKSAYFNRNVTHVKVGDYVLFRCVQKSDGRTYFDSVYVVKK